MKNFFLKTSSLKNYMLFSLFLLLFGGGNVWGQTYNQITLLTELTNGEYLIVGDGGTTDGIMVNTSDPTPYINYTAVTNPGASISSGVTAANVFIIDVIGSEITIYNASVGYVSWGNTGTGTVNHAGFFNSTPTNKEKWTFSVASGLWTLANLNTPARLLQWNNSSPRFACYTTPQVKLKLYKINQKTVTFDKNDPAATGTMSNQSSATAANLSSNGFSNTGFTFAGWATTPTGSVAYADGASFPFTANATLYAKWTSASPSPAITSSLAGSITYGDAFPYSIVATNSPTSYSASGLPAGLSINTSTGAISGTPTTTVGSPFSITIGATNGSGSDSKTLVLTINKKALTISGLTATSKVYDQTITASVSGTATLNGIINSDAVTLAGPPTASFASANVGTGIAVSVTGYSLTGANAGNYTLTAPSGLTANITAKALTVTSPTANNKTYDGTNSATISGTLTGIISGDVVTLSGTGTFASVNAATGIVVTSTSTLGGAQAGNYSLTQPTGLTADITKANQTITFTAISDKVLSLGSFAISATSSSGQAVVFAGTTPTTISVSGTTVSLVALGAASITASVAASTNYNAATDVVQGFNVIDGPCLDDDFNSSYGNWTGGSGTYNSNGAAVVSGNGIGFNSTNDDIITSSALSNPQSITFYCAASSGTSNFTMNIEYSTSASGPWSTAASLAANGSNTGGVTSSAVFKNISLSLTGNYFLRIIQSARSGGSFYLDDVQVFCGAAGAEINLKGNSTSIVNTDATPSLTDHTDFGSTAVVGGTIDRTFTIENTGGADLTLTGTGPTYVAISGTHSTDFSITANPSTPISATSNTTFTVHFDPSALGLRTATISIANDDSDENPYTFAIQGTGVNSASSDIIETSGFSYTSNIDYTLFQGNPVSTTSTGVASFGFTIRDGAGASDADALGTELTAISFTTVNIANVRSAALFSGTTFIANATSISGGNINFTGLSGPDVTAADNGSKDLVLYVSFLTTVTDNAQLQYTVNSATASTSGSVFANPNAGGATSSITGDRNRLEVTASKIEFVQQPTTTNVAIAITPSPTVQFVDANGNKDFDINRTITLTTSGTGMTSSTPYTLTAPHSGVATLSGISFASAQTGITLTATTSGLVTSNVAVSNSFDIVLIVIANGAYRTASAGTWPNATGAATWERFTSGAWGSSAKPSVSTTDMLYIRHTITTNGAFAGNPGGTTMIVENGGNFQAGHNCTFASLLVENGGVFSINHPAVDITTAGTITIESGGKVISNSATFNNFDGFWKGTENFKSGSTFEILEWDWDNSSDGERLIDFDNTVSTNSDGYYFGNIIVSGTPVGKAFTLVGLVGSHKLCKNNLTINNASAALSVILTVVSANVEIGGDVIVNSNKFAFGALTSADVVHTIKGNIILNAGTIDLNQNNSGVGTVKVNLEGNLIGVSGNLINTDNKIDCSINFINTSLIQNIDMNPVVTMNKISLFISEGSETQLLNNNLNLNSNSSLNVLNGGTLNFNWNGVTPLLVKEATSPSGTNTFTSEQGSTLKITHPSGIVKTVVADGNVQLPTTNKVFNQKAIFWYIGKVNQFTGNGITNTNNEKNVICDLVNNTTELRLTNSITIKSNTTSLPYLTGVLDIRKGKVIETTTEFVDASTGTLFMSPGTWYYIPKGNNSSASSNSDLIPRLSAGTIDYNLTGGTIEFAGTGVNAFQTLRGSQIYHNILFSGANTYLTDYKNISNNATVNSQVELTGTTVVDCINGSGSGKSFIGNGGLKMSGTSRLRIKKFTTANPELNGIANPYELTSGTIEFYGTGNTDNQLIRGVYNTTTNIIYNNLEIKADVQNDEYGTSDFFNVSPAASFGLKGNMQVFSPAVFRFDALEIVSGIGNITLDPGATLLYGSANGLTASGTTTSDGNVRVSGSRSFPTTASYGFIGNQNQVSGSGLPTSMVNLYVDKTSATLLTTLTNDLTMSNKLHFQKGNVVTNGKLFELGTSTANKGTLTYIDGFVLGSMRRWFNGVNAIDITSSLFPMGIDATGLKNRFVQVGFSAAPATGGHLTATFIPTAMGVAGLPLLNPSQTGGFGYDVTSTENQGYWQMDNQAGALTGADYTIACTGEGFTTITDLTQITLLKRVGTGNWFCPGVHLSPSGTTAMPTVSRSGVSNWSNFGFGGSDANPLPVELTRFDATCLGNETVISWETASEQNAESFILEFSSDALFWQKLEEIPASGNSATTQKYATRDQQRGLNYYRLLQRDYNGNINDYGIIASNCQSGSEIQVFPNPTNGQVTFLNLPETSSELEIVIYATDGRLVLTHTVQGTSTVFSLGELNAGIYTFSILEDKKSVKNGKIVKQ